MVPLDDPPVLVLEGATLLDGTGGPPRPEITVVVQGEQIVQVEPTGTGSLPAAAQVDNVCGKILIPGLVDAHAHAEDDWVLALLLALGITQIRNPALCFASEPTAPKSGPSPRPAILTAGPAIDLASSNVLGCVAVQDEAELRAEVVRQAEAGVDYVKLYTRLPPELVAAGIDEAHRRGVKVIGDLSRTSWIDAARAGIDFLAHALPRQPNLLPSAARSGYAQDCLTRRPGTLWRWFELVDLDGPEIAELIAVLVDHGVVVDPTLVGLEALLFAEDPDYRAEVRPADALLPEDSSLRLAVSPGEGPPTRSADATRAIWRTILGLVGRLHEAGVRLLAGTDTPRPMVVPGASLWRELALLVDAGLSADEALAVATGRGAEFLGIADQTGTVAPGKRADLVLMSTDPRSFRNAPEAIEWVMARGCRHASHPGARAAPSSRTGRPG